MTMWADGTALAIAAWTQRNLDVAVFAYGNGACPVRRASVNLASDAFFSNTKSPRSTPTHQSTMTPPSTHSISFVSSSSRPEPGEQYRFTLANRHENADAYFLSFTAIRTAVSTNRRLSTCSPFVKMNIVSGSVFAAVEFAAPRTRYLRLGRRSFRCP